MTDFETRNDADRFRFMLKFNFDEDLVSSLDDEMTEWYESRGGVDYVEERPENLIELIDKAREVAIGLGLWQALE